MPDAILVIGIYPNQPDTNLPSRSHRGYNQYDWLYPFFVMGFYIKEREGESVFENAWGPILTVRSGYRFYNPSTGRWLNRDPIGEQGGVNLYAMVGNNAVNFIDLLGRERFEFDSQGPHVNDAEIDGKRLDYVYEFDENGKVRFFAKPGHEEHFDPKRAARHFENSVNDKGKWNLMRRSIADAFDEMSDNKGMSHRGRCLRRVRGMILLLGLVAATAEGASNPQLVDLRGDLKEVKQTVEDGNSPSDVLLTLIASRTKDVFGSEAAGLKLRHLLDQLGKECEKVDCDK
jgi:hypothetical protein